KAKVPPPASTASSRTARTAVFRRIGVSSPCDVAQQTPAVPGVVGTIPVDVPFVGHVELPGSMLEGVGVGVGIAGTPLMPAFPISVEPKGIPARLAPPGEIVEGDDEMVPLPLLVSAPPQGDVGLPDAAIPVVPPIPAVLPVAGVPPIVLVPPPSNVPVELVPGVPDVALPVVVH